MDLRRVVLCAIFAVASFAVSTSIDARQSNTLTFGLTPTTSTIVFHPSAALQNPNRTWADPNFTTTNGRKIAVGDITGDGLIDIVLAPSYGRFQPKLTMQFWINQGGGKFADTPDIVENGPIETGTGSIFIADFNRDGRNDIFMADYGLEDKLPAQGFDGGVSHVLLSQPNGRLRDVSTTSLPGEPAANNHPSNMADLNGDGAMDVILQRLGGLAVPGQGTALKMNDGTGRFTETITGLPREIAYLPRVEGNGVPDRQAAGTVGSCDFDANGRTDLVTASYTNQSFPRNVRVFEQSTGGAFTERFRIPIPPEIVQAASQRTTLNVGAAGLSCADMNGDRLPDVAVHWETDSGSTYVQFLRNTGGFRFVDATLEWFGRWETYYPIRNGTRAAMGVSLRDINGDGSPDFIPLSQGSLEPQHLWDGGFAYLNDGTGRLTPLAYRGTNPSTTVTDFGRAICSSFCTFFPLLFDATGDGMTDLVLLDSWTFRSTDAPVREDRVLVQVLAGQHNRSTLLKAPSLFGKP